MIVLDNNCNYVTKDVFEKFEKNQIDLTYILVVLRDLVPSGPSIGYVVKNDKVEKGILAQGVYGIKLNKNLQDSFLIQYSNTPQYRTLMKTIMVGSTQVHIRNTTYLDIDIPHPSIEEQQKIADFLSEVDNIIAASEQEIESLEMQKKGAMQKLFSQEVRFKADDGSEYPEWEEKILGDICELITKGTTPKDYSNNPEDINYIKIESIVANKICLDKCTKIEKTIHEGVLKRSILKEGDILFAIAGSLGTMAVVEKNMLPANTNQALAIIRLNKECCSQYIYTVLSSTVMTQYIKQCCTIGAQPNLSLKQMNDFAFPYPCLEEQQKIADFLSEFDNAIEYAKEELEVWKNIKKGLLQQMFE